MADRVFSEDTQKKLIEEFDKVETEEMRAGTHENFHKILDNLHDIYLK